MLYIAELTVNSENERVIKISKLADYAICIIQVMDATECLSASKIAQKSAISEPTVSKILKKLAESRLLLSVQGPRGGYQLVKSSEKISLAELITVMDGGLTITECCKKEYDCAHVSHCGQQHSWQVVNHLIFSVLDRISLLDMKNGISQQQVKKIEALQFL